MNKKVHIAIFASGRGSNAKAIYEYSKVEGCNYKVGCILSNRKNAGVLDFATEHDIPCSSFTKDEFQDSEVILSLLQENNVDLIVLAGFLWLIPGYLVESFPKKMLNIHPALLPKYGGKGMYGHHVHEAVKENKEVQSGMTIHFVNKEYDEGQMIFQSQCQLQPEDSPEDIANRVLKLEHHFYPRVVDGVASRL